MGRKLVETKNALLFSSLLFFTLTGNSEPLCDFKYWHNYNEVSIFKGEKSYFFVTDHIAIDADGAPNAYHPEDIGLDYLANAGYPDKKWWKSVLVADKKNTNTAYQQESGKYKGFFISKTSLQDSSKDIYDVDRYVNASTYPYLVFPRKFYKKKGTGLLGDIGYALNLTSGETSPFVIADIGPTNASLGEISINLAERLGGDNVNPRNGAGAPKGDILYVIFPYSSNQYEWPIKASNLERATKSKILSQGGINDIKSCAEDVLHQ